MFALSYEQPSKKAIILERPSKKAIILGCHSSATSSMPASLVDTIDNTESADLLTFRKKKSVQNGGQEKTIEIERQRRDCTETEERLDRDRGKTGHRERGETVWISAGDWIDLCRRLDGQLKMN